MTTSCFRGVRKKDVARFQLTTSTFGLISDGVLHRAKMGWDIRCIGDKLAIRIKEGA